MEITIDAALVEAVLSDEAAQARRDFQTLDPVEALAHSQMRHDARLAAAPDAATLACKAGCFWCCYFTVDVRAVELVRILDYMEQVFTPEAREQTRREAAENAAALEGVGDLGRMQRNLKCPFLRDGRCSIYPVRPQTCRNYHATNAAGCQQSFEQPDNLDIDPDFAPLVYQSGAAHVEAFCAAMCEVGYDVRAYELNAALAAALADPASARTRFAAKQSPCPGVEGAIPPVEFLEAP